MPQIPTQVSFRNMDKPMGVEERVLENVEALGRFHANITGCRVMIERRNHRHRTGDFFQVRIDVTVPGAELVVNHEPAQDRADEALTVTVRAAFDEIRRRIEDHVRRARTDR